MLKNVKKSTSGITLIALVITIIILLILAGVSISMVIGENGIATKAKEAKLRTEEAEKNEKKDLIKLENELEKIDEDERIIDFEKIKVAVLKEKEIYLEFAQELGQDSSNLDIGIGTDGNIVNMDLWVYQVIADSYISLNSINSCGYNDKSYNNSDIVDGKIQGTIPQYIYIYALDKFLPVTNLDGTFKGCTDLEVAPEIPNIVTSMRETFLGCKNLTIAPIIPEGVTNLWYTFYNCKNLEKCILPENIKVVGYHAFSYNEKLHLYFEHIEKLPSFDQYGIYNCPNLIVYLKNSEMAEAFSAKYSSITVSDNYNW